jgi:hypothetical protein
MSPGGADGSLQSPSGIHCNSGPMLTDGACRDVASESPTAAEPEAAAPEETAAPDCFSTERPQLTVLPGMASVATFGTGGEGVTTAGLVPTAELDPPTDGFEAPVRN